MTIRFPRPLVPGDTIAVTSPSSGVADRMRPRLDAAVDHLRARGFDVVIGECMAGDRVTSASAVDRAAELTAFLTDPAVRAVVPPWGGELAIDLLGRLDWDAFAADPTWLVGFSDISTLTLPMTVRAGVASLVGQNLMDTPYRVPAPLRHWIDVVSAPPGASLEQGAVGRHRAAGHDDYVSDPAVDEYTLDAEGGWIRLDDGHAALHDTVHASGRLVGGCLETVSDLAAGPYGDVPTFAATHAPEGLVVHLEAAESGAYEVARRLWGLRHAGWFDAANAVLVGRTRAPDEPGFTQHDAVRDALGDLGVPVLADVECGHVPPYLALVDGALATVDHGPTGSRLLQHLS